MPARGKPGQRSLQILRPGARTGPAPSSANSTPTSGFLERSSSTPASSRPRSRQRGDSSPARSPTPTPPSARSPTRTTPSTRRCELLPPVFRQSNTTFVNLRAALDDLDPLVETAKPATKNLAPFLRRTAPGPLQSGAGVQEPPPHRQPPRLRQRRRRTARLPARGAAARLAGLPARRRGDRGLPAEPQLRSAPTRRTSSTASAKLGQVTGYYDGNGHYARVQLATSTSSTTTAAAASSNRSRPANSTTPSAARPASRGAARAARTQPPPTAPTRSSNRRSPAPA